MHMHWTLKRPKALLYTAVFPVISSWSEQGSCPRQPRNMDQLPSSLDGFKGRRPLEREQEKGLYYQTSDCILLYTHEISAALGGPNRDGVGNFIVTVTVLLHVYLLAASFYYTIFSLPPSIFTAQTCCLKMAPWPWNV